MPMPATNGVVEWSWDEEKAFESALAEDNETSNDDGGGDDDERRRKKKKSGGGGGGMDWEWIASKVGSKTPAEFRVHYKMLVEDIEAIEAGKIPIPRYVGEESAIKEKEHGNYSHKNSNNQQQQNSNNLLDRRGFEGKGCSKAEQERKKGIPWTEEEHRLFLLGLDKFGKGDWRSISRNFVVSRTPTQVASHAQKYFIRLNSMNRDRRRSSIHDITMVNGENSSSSAQGPITGQTNGNPAALVGPSPMEHAVQGVGMYSPPMGHPVTGHMVSAAVGTPVMLPPGHPPYVMPVAYPVPPPTMHQ